MSELARRFPAYVGQLSSAHGPEAGAAVERRWIPIGPVFDDVARKKAAIYSSIELSTKGKEQKIGDLAATDGAAVAKRLLNVKESIRREYDELLGDENAAQQALVKDPGGSGGYVRDGSARVEPTPENTMLAVEIRAQLKTMKNHEARDCYLKAVADGSDPMLVYAVESCPSPRFQLVDRDTLNRAREIRIAVSPMREAIARARDVYDVNVLLFEIAWRELYALVPGVPDVQADPPLPQRTVTTLPFGVERVSRQLAS